MIRVRFGFLHTFLLSGLGSVQFLSNPGFWFGSFLLDSGSFPSVTTTTITTTNTEEEDEEEDSYLVSTVSCVFIVYYCIFPIFMGGCQCLLVVLLMSMFCQYV